MFISPSLSRPSLSPWSWPWQPPPASHRRPTTMAGGTLHPSSFSVQPRANQRLPLSQPPLSPPANETNNPRCLSSRPTLPPHRFSCQVLPKMMGFEPISLMPSQDEVSIVVKCLKFGVADYLVKPLRTLVVELVDSHVEKKANVRATKGLRSLDDISTDEDMEDADEFNEDDF
ncbi:hypothetical protein BC332_24039 [Capsicum chinense]|nr:hypothetical protein BC332_24039 [Capsicum chinense]